MELSKQRKVYIGILGVAALGFLVDRAFLGPEEASGAYVEPAPSDFAVRTSTSEDLFSSVMVGEPSGGRVSSIANRLAEVGKTDPVGPDDLKDAFRPVPEWMAELSPKGKRGPGSTDNVQLFREKYRIMGVGGGRAIIHGEFPSRSKEGETCVEQRMMQVGDRAGDFTVVSITQTSVVFACGDTQVELSLGKDGVSDQKR